MLWVVFVMQTGKKAKAASLIVTSEAMLLLNLVQSSLAAAESSSQPQLAALGILGKLRSCQVSSLNPASLAL